MTDISDKKCVPCEGGIPALTKTEAENYLQQLSGWQLDPNATTITKTYEFRNYYRTMAFVNAVAWMASGENHHPDLEVSYNKCMVNYTTHAVNGLSENDFICAAKVDKLLEYGPS